MSSPGSYFQRWILPGFAFKAVVIGGGYATGRELAEFFLPAGPWGGVLGMLLAMMLWSGICAITFLFARATASLDYGTFFKALLGPASALFDLAYFPMVLLMLSVFAAAAGEIGHALLDCPQVSGILALCLAIAGFAAFGQESVERLFEYVTILLYAVYAIFLGLALFELSPEIRASFAGHTLLPGWSVGGLTYAGYNIIGAVVVLPVLRHLKNDRDALVAGLLCGPLGMLPALAFFVVMSAFYPGIGSVALPSDYLLSRLGLPVFHVLFQCMIFAALLESGVGAVHAVNERVSGVLRRHSRSLSKAGRWTLSSIVLVLAICVAARFGLIALIGNGYRFLSFVFLTVYVAPLLTYGLWRVCVPRHASRQKRDAGASALDVSRFDSQ